MVAPSAMDMSSKVSAGAGAGAVPPAPGTTSRRSKRSLGGASGAPPRPHTSAREWSDLVVELESIQLGSDVTTAGLKGARKPPVSRCRSEQTLFSRKRDVAYLEGDHRRTSAADEWSDDSSSDDEKLSLGSPPPMPPVLKRARACSFSPDRSHINFFSSDQGRKDTDSTSGPRQ